MSLEEGKLYLPTLGEDGVINLVTRGDSGILGKQFAIDYNSPLGWEPDPAVGEVRIATMDSTLSYADITVATEQRCGDLMALSSPPEEFESVHIESESGQICDSNGTPIGYSPVAHDTSVHVPIAPQLTFKPSSLPSSTQPTTSRPRRSPLSTALPMRYAQNAIRASYSAFVTLLLMAGLAISGQSIASVPVPPPASVFATSAISVEEFMRKNPKWGKASIGSDRDKWLAADKKEHDQQILPQRS